MAAHHQTDVVLVSVENGALPSFAMPSLEAYLSRAGIKTAILYPRVNRWSLSVLTRNILDLNPRVVGLGGLFNDRFIIKNIIESLVPYRRSLKIVIGGNLVTPIPEFMVNKLSADIGVVGEGELIFTRLVEKILGNKDYSKIGGLVFRDNSEVISTGPGEYIDNLDDLLPLNYEKIPMEHFINVYKFYRHITRNNLFTPRTRLGAVATGRGCAYRCNFCYHFNRFRLLKIPLIISQIKQLKERFNINMVRFVDDLTIVSKKRALELCGALIAEKLGLKHIVSAHFNCLDEEIVVALKKSGCVGVALGLESGSQSVLDKINKGIKIEQIRNGLDLLRKHKMSWNGGIQIGQLGETEADVRKTRDLFYSYIDEFSTVSVAITTPYPGTALYHYGIKAGLIKSNEELFGKFGDLRTLVANFSKLSSWRIRYLRPKMAFEFDLKKQKKLRGRLGAYLFLLRILIIRCPRGLRKFFKCI